MIAGIRHLVDATPFVPFTIHTANGRTFRVPTVDHVAVTPNNKSNKSVFIFGDNEGDYEVPAPLLIAPWSVERSESASSAGA